MRIREQGSVIKVLRVEPPTQQPGRGRRRELLLGAFRDDEPIPPALLDTLTRDERKALARWVTAYRESRARSDARTTLSTAPAQLESLVSALETAADTLSAADADQMWAQLQAIARTLRRAGHPRPRTARRPPAPMPGQRDFFRDVDEFGQLAV